jgi:predicted nucleic acid-binding protein
MGTLIDTSVLIAAERGEVDLAALAEREPEEIAVSAVTASELLHGVHRLRGVSRARAEMYVERILSLVPVIPFDLAIGRVHAALSADLRAAGTPVGAHDLIIAATAVWLEYNVATRDLRSFPKIKGLTLRRW